jgi:hypothetical protein
VVLVSYAAYLSAAEGRRVDLGAEQGEMAVSGQRIDR